MSQNWLNFPTMTNTRLNKHIWPDQVLNTGRTQTTNDSLSIARLPLFFIFIILNLIWAKIDVAIRIIYRL